MDSEFMTVHMIRTERGSPDGVRLQRYIAGQDYDLPVALARQFISMGVAQPAIENPEKKYAKHNR